MRLSQVSVAAIIDSRVLMMWRYRFLPNRFGWELPGGIVERGESAADAAGRKVEEENRLAAGRSAPAAADISADGGHGGLTSRAIHRSWC